MDKLLSDSEVRRIAGTDSKVLLYPDLKKFKNLNQLFGRKNKLIILYLNEKTQNSVIGHWVLVTRLKRDGKEIIEVNDSYGNTIDEPLDWHSDKKNEELDQDGGYLSSLLYDYCNGEEDRKEIYYNELVMQKSKPNINTCGRFVGVRAHFYDIPLEQYQSIFRNLKKEGHDLDKVIVELSDKLLSIK